jgi:hypothetical protein
VAKVTAQTLTVMDALIRYAAQSEDMRGFAQRALVSARNSREEEFVKALLRHARGAQVAVACWKQELQIED